MLFIVFAADTQFIVVTKIVLLSPFLVKFDTSLKTFRVSIAIIAQNLYNIKYETAYIFLNYGGKLYD